MNNSAVDYHDKLIARYISMHLSIWFKQVDRFAGRFVRNVGLGFKTPREAAEGTYIDKKCPFTGNVSIRGRILNGTVMSLKMQVCKIISVSKRNMLWNY